MDAIITDSTVTLTATEVHTATLPPTCSPSPSISPPASSDGEQSQAWIAGVVIGPLAGIVLCVAAYILWRRRHNHHDHNRPTSPKREAPPRIADSHQDVPRSELMGQNLEPAMLHSENTAGRLSELPG